MSLGINSNKKYFLFSVFGEELLLVEKLNLIRNVWKMGEKKYLNEKFVKNLSNLTFKAGIAILHRCK